MSETLSLCMIVKDEERFIGRCLESVRDVFDDVVVVDTGSRDGTKDIAKKFGARVFLHPWKDDFSQARNVSLSKARGDWIFILDADEELYREDIPAIRQAVTKTDVDGFLVMNINTMPDGGLCKHKNVRLFRKGKVKYEGIVHNQPIVDGPVCDSSIRILHHGYNLSPEEMSKKFQRSESLLRKQVDSNPDDTYAWANLIRNHRLQQKWDEVRTDGEKVLAFPSIRLFDRQMITNDLMYAYFITGRVQEAEVLGREGLKDNPYHPDMLFILGGVMIKQERIREAISYFLRYLDVLQSGAELPGLEGLLIDSYGFQGRAWNNIGSGYLALGNTELAVIGYQNAIQREPGNSQYYKNMAGLYLQTDYPESALLVLQQAQQAGIVDAVIDSHVQRLKGTLRKTHPAGIQTSKATV